ncbi:adenosine 5'-monophosphoramidase HINT3-like [Dysidea avara]|uniref:adenosine 5'-monophosphoramidase HINT3-like n=1 Tax=Dysidea avara TaxID=196820 RepID=UPI0033283947
MFLAYINDITTGASSKIRLFADDCILYRTIVNKTIYSFNQILITEVWKMGLNVSMATSDVGPLPHDTCVFCQIVSGKKDTELLYNDDQYVCFRDIRPVSQNHYLVVPIAHHPEAKYLAKEHIGMVRRMIEVGQSVLKTQGGDLEDCRMGFHWPPFTSVKHLHLHIISPVSEMSFLNKHIVYRPNSFAFVTHDWLVNRLESMS